MSTTPELQYQNSGLPFFSQAIANTALQTAAGNCSNTQDFTDKFNDVLQRLMIRGDWPGTLLPIQINVQKGVVTFPRYVGAVRAFNLCHGGVPVWGEWFTFLAHYWHKGNCCGVFQNWITPRHSPRLEQFGTGVQFAVIPTSTCVLKVYSSPQDNGAVIQFFGLDPNGNNLVTPVGTTSISQGISITCNQPFTVDTNLVASISRVSKPVTQAPIQVSALDTASGVETPIAAFDGGDTNPSFAQYKLHMFQCNTTTTTFPAVALVKLKFIPVASPADLVPIPSMAALTMMMKAVRFQDAGDRANFLGYQADAVKELNLLLADTLPDFQVPIDFSGFGSATPGRHGIGRLR